MRNLPKTKHFYPIKKHQPTAKVMKRSLTEVAKTIDSCSKYESG